MNDENIPYLRSVGLPQPAQLSDRDERDFSTLEYVQKTLSGAIEDLYKDFNAFDLKTDKVSVETQIAARQIAYDMLIPLKSTVDSAINSVINKEG